jgi:hypothetical protein
MSATMKLALAQSCKTYTLHFDSIGIFQNAMQIKEHLGWYVACVPRLHVNRAQEGRTVNRAILGKECR